MTFLGIVIPALLLVAAVRRWVADVPWKVALLFLALTLAFLGGAVFSSKLPVPVDEVARGYPWRGVVGNVEPKNPSTNDTVKLFLPWMQVAREELFHFRAPLWNRYSFSGYPLLGNGESAPFSPLFLATLFVPLPKQIVAMAGLKLFAALVFTYLFMRRERASEEASIFAAVAFAFSVIMTVYLYYSTASVVAFLPAAAFALLHVLDEPRKRSVVFLALVIATLQANGHPESVLHIAIACGVILAIEFRREHVRHVPLIVVGVILGLALSAPAWLPVLEQVRLSARFAELRAGVSFGKIPRAAAWAIVAPNGFGSPVRHNYSWFVGYANVATSHPGFLPLALAVAAAFARRTSTRDRLYVVVAVILFVIAMDWTVMSRVPPFSLVANEKLRFASIFLIAVVAAKAIDRLRWSVAVAGALLAVPALYVYSRSALLRPIDLFGFAAIALFFVLPRKWAFLAVTAELFVLNVPFNALVSPRYYRPRLPILEALRAHAPAEPFRVAGLDWTLLPNASAEYGLEDVRGSDPMAFAAYDAYLRRFTVQQEGTWVRRIVDASRPELDALNVRFFLAEPGTDLPAPRWRRLYSGPDGVLFENIAARPRFWLQNGGADALVRPARTISPAEFAFQARGPADIQSTQLAPGWRVAIAGKEVPTSMREGAFLTFHVPPGEWPIRVWYQPFSWRIGLAVAAAAMIFLIFWNMRWGVSVVRRPDTGKAVL